MIQSEFRFTLDTHAAASQVSLGVKKGETGRRLRIHLTEAGYPYHIPDNCYAVFAATKPDGKKIFNDCVIDDCEIIYDMTEQTVAAAGLMVCAINLYGVENDLLISASFSIIVYCPPVDQDELESTSEYKALAALIAEAEALKEGMEEGGGPGGYYVPLVDQPNEDTFQISWMASGEGLPAVPPAVVELPGGGNDSGQNVNLSAAQVEALHGMFKVCAYNKSDVSAEYTALKTAFGIADSGDDDGGDEETHTHSYTSEVTTEATCTTAGVRTYTCACGESYTEEILATGHSYVDGACTVCGAVDPDYSPQMTLTSISATYSGGDVAVGTAAEDLTGIVVTAHYSDGTSATITGFDLIPTVITEGDNEIAVTYQGKTATFNVVGIVEGPEIIVPTAENAFVTATFDIASTIVTNGVASGNASWEATDYIEIPEVYEYVMWRTASTAAYRGAFFDADKAYIRNITDATAIGAAKQVRDLIPDNAKYMRLSTTTSNGLDSVELSFGNNFVTGWSDTSDHYVESDGTIKDGYTGTVQQRVTDGYIQLPEDAAMLIWGSRAGYTYRYMKIVVYDRDFNILKATAYDGTAFFAVTDVSCVLDLTAVTDAAYIRCAAWDNGAAANDDPATQIVYGYCR